jgi:hypothetical protein
MSEDALAWDAWQKQPGHDIGDAPGMDPYIQIGRGALERGKKERMGTGALALGDPGSSGHAAKLREMGQAEAAQQFGAGLENAYAMRNAEVKGSYGPLAQLELGRKMGQLNNTSQAQALWVQKQRKSPWDYALEGASTFGPMLFGA